MTRDLPSRIISSTSHAAPRMQSGFFTHHGVWAPGVRLFRNLNFRAKALLVSFVFMVPVALLTWSFLKDKAEAQEFSSKERVGVSYVREAIPLVRLGQSFRLYALQAQANGGRGSPELAEARKARDLQMQKVEAVEAAFGADLGTAKALADVKSTAEAATSASGEATFAAHSAFIQAVVALIAQAADGSNLTLDPDLDTYYLMDASLGALPVMAEAAAKLRGLAAAAAASGTPPAEAAQRTMFAAGVATELFEGRVDTALEKVYSVHPDYKAEFAAEALLPALHSFREAALAGKGDAATFIKDGTFVVDGLSALQAKMVDRLDKLLQDRIDGVAQKRWVTLATVLASLFLGTYFFYSFYLVTKGGLNEVKRHLVAMTEGDLTTHPHPWGTDEAANLMISLQDMQAAVRSIVSRVRGSSE